MIPAGAGGVAGKDVAAEIRALSKQLEELKSQLAWYQRDNEYRLDTLSMKRSWQDSTEGNLDNITPLTIDLYIPPETKEIARVILRLRLLEYRTCVSPTTEWVGDGPVMPIETGDAIWGRERDWVDAWTSDDGEHEHGGAVPMDGSHSHTIDLPVHHHIVGVADHYHKINPGVLLLDAAEGVRIYINGSDVTGAMGGPFYSDQASLDITQYIRPIGWNEIRFTSATVGRLRATAFVEIYLP